MNKTILSLTLMGGLAMASGAQAAFFVDDFSDDTALITAAGNETTSPLSGSDFSNSRALSIIENPMSPSGATVIVFGDVLGISTGVGAGSDTTSEYNNAAGFDFTVAEAGGSIFDTFVLSLLSIDQGGVDITLTVDGVSSTQFVNTVGDVLFAHALFGNVSSVNDIELFIHNNIEVDAIFDSFKSFGNERKIQVPEPTSLALLGISLTAFGFTRRKAKK